MLLTDDEIQQIHDALNEALQDETIRMWLLPTIWLAANRPLIKTEAQYSTYREKALQLVKLAPGEPDSIEFGSSPEGRMAAVLTVALMQYDANHTPAKAN